MTDLIEQNFIDGSKPTCRVIRTVEQFHCKQGHLLAPGIQRNRRALRESICGSQQFHPVDDPRRTSTRTTKQPFTYSPANQACGSARVLNTISSPELATFFTSPPICLICPTI